MIKHELSDGLRYIAKRYRPDNAIGLSPCDCDDLDAAADALDALAAENAKLRELIAAEREACAKVCECQAEACIKMATDTAIKDVSLLTVAKWYRNNAAAIRSRSQTPNGGEVAK